MTPRVITAPEPIITLAQAKAHLRVETIDDDALIEAYIAAAQASIDGPTGTLGRSLNVQTLELSVAAADLLCWPAIALTYGSVIDVVSVVYGTAATALDPSAFTLQPGAVDPLASLCPALGTSWPWAAADVVKVRYRAGFATMPPQLVAAMFLMTADLYGTRDAKIADTLVENPTIARLLAPFQVY